MVHTKQFARDTSQLGPIRGFVRSSLRDAEVAASVIGDFELAISELATNAMQHGSGHLVDVHLDIGRDLVSATIGAEAESATSIGGVDTWQIAPPQAVSGRGLGIVAALMDEVEFTGEHGRAVVRCAQRR